MYQNIFVNLIVFRILSYHIGNIQTIDKIPQLKIIGGRTVGNRSDFAYQVSLRYGNRHFCGGAIIDHSFILTAAHCCFDNEDRPWKTKNMRVVAGDLNINNISNLTVIRNVAKIHVHPKYNPDSIINDIALWEVSSPFFWNYYVQPVRITDKTQMANTLCNISGWGVIDYEKEIMDNNLRFVEVSITKKSICRKIYPEIDYINVICAGNRGRDSCQGDSGGALVCNRTLTGIVSYGVKCGIYPGVYTDVYSYRSWIRSKIYISSANNSYKYNAMISILLIFLLIMNK